MSHIHASGLTVAETEALRAPKSHRLGETLVPKATGVIWTPSPNYSVGRSGLPILWLVEHIAQGTTDNMLDPASQVSAHYAIKQDGTIIQYVHEADTAWHAGNWPVNLQAIGIERWGYNTSSWTVAQRAADIRLGRDLVLRYRLPIDDGDILGRKPGILAHGGVCYATGTCDHYGCPTNGLTGPDVGRSWTEYYAELTPPAPQPAPTPLPKETPMQYVTVRNPADPNRLDHLYRDYRGSIQHDYSSDGGATWSSDNLGGTASGDPSGEWRPDGTFHVYHPSTIVGSNGDFEVFERVWKGSWGDWHPTKVWIR